MGVWLEEEKIHGDVVSGRFMKGFVQGKGAERVLGAWGQGKDLCMKSIGSQIPVERIIIFHSSPWKKWAMYIHKDLPVALSV